MARDLAACTRRLEGEQRERAETEAALQELVHEVQTLSGDRDKARSGRSAAEHRCEGLEIRVAELRTRLQHTETARADAELGLQQQLQGRVAVEESLRQLEANRDAQETAAAAARQALEEEVARLRDRAARTDSLEAAAAERERAAKEAERAEQAARDRADRAEAEAAGAVAAEERRWGDRLEAAREEARRARVDCAEQVDAMRAELARVAERARKLELQERQRESDLQHAQAESYRLQAALTAQHAAGESGRGRISELQAALRRAIAAARDANGKVRGLRDELDAKTRDLAAAEERASRARQEGERRAREEGIHARRREEAAARLAEVERELEVCVCWSACFSLCLLVVRVHCGTNRSIFVFSFCAIYQAEQRERVAAEARLRAVERTGRATNLKLMQELEAIRSSYHQFIDVSKGMVVRGGVGSELLGVGRSSPLPAPATVGGGAGSDVVSGSVQAGEGGTFAERWASARGKYPHLETHLAAEQTGGTAAKETKLRRPAHLVRIG